jgi:two-component system, LytTR family, sensor kinase
VFTASMMLFSHNFFWKLAYEPKKQMPRIVLLVLTNFVLILAISGLFVILAVMIFDVKAVKAYFLVYFFRNLTITVVVILVTYVVNLVERLRQEKIEFLLLQQQNTETELAALKSQIDPHFLFNTLTTLSSLVRNNSKETVSFIDHMADTFRYMLENRSQKVVVVKDELSFLHSYIFMMKKRFEEGLHVEMGIRNEHLERTIPQFALQTVVENAMKHNVVSAKQALRIEITSNDNSITVRNNLKEKKFSQGYGIGLNNLAQRYRLIGEKEIKVTKGDNFFEVMLPLL